jgi:hypothetical protein
VQGIYPEHAVFMVPLPSLGRSPPSAFFFLGPVNTFTVIPCTSIVRRRIWSASLK